MTPQFAEKHAARVWPLIDKLLLTKQPTPRSQRALQLLCRYLDQKVCSTVQTLPYVHGHFTAEYALIYAHPLTLWLPDGTALVAEPFPLFSNWQDKATAA